MRSPSSAVIKKGARAEMKRDWSRVKGAIGFVFAAAMVVNLIWMINMIVCEGYGGLKGWW